MSLRISEELPSAGLKGLGGATVGATDALGPGVEQGASGELPATAPAAVSSSDGPNLGGLLFALSLALLAGYLFRDRNEQSKEE